MEYGFSMVLQDFVHATEVGYEDCEPFMIVCPSCLEHVYKVGSEVLSRQYLSHFPLKGQPDCELRVQQIIKERYDAKAVMPRGQQLDKLLARFEAIITEPFRSLSTPEGRSVIRHLNEMRGRHRSVFVIAVEKHRRQLRQLWQNPKEPFNSLAATNNRGWANQPQDWRDCLNTVMGYLTSENAGRALLFAVCHGLLILQGLTFEIEERPDDFVRNGINLENWLEHTDYLLLMDADNADLRKYFSILWDTPHHKGMDHFVAQCASAVTTTGVVFVNRVLTFPSRGVQFQPPASRGGCD